MCRGEGASNIYSSVALVRICHRYVGSFIYGIYCTFIHMCVTQTHQHIRTAHNCTNGSRALCRPRDAEGRTKSCVKLNSRRARVCVAPTDVMAHMFSTYFLHVAPKHTHTPKRTREVISHTRAPLNGRARRAHSFRM